MGRVADAGAGTEPVRLDPEERVELLLRDLRGSPSGLSAREAERRLVHYGPTSFADAASALAARALAWFLPHASAVGCCPGLGGGDPPVAIAIVVVILINAAFAFVQEMQAERAVEALAEYLPDRARGPQGWARAGPGRRPAGARRRASDRGGRPHLMPGSSRGRGRPLHAERGIGPRLPGRSRLEDTSVPWLEARDLVFSGTTCNGPLRAIVFATGMQLGGGSPPCRSAR